MAPVEALLSAVLYLGGEVAASRGALVQPIREVRISSEYGVRADPVHGKYRFHEGIDIAAPAGSPVLAVASGQVIFSGSYAGYGQVVAVRHSEKVTTLYAHCWATKVSVGDIVKAGAVLGFVGESGRATGPHLHFEVRVRGKSINPNKVFKAIK